MCKNVAPEFAAAASLYASDGRRKYLNHDERQRLLAAAERMPPEQRLFVELVAWSGARVTELLALTPGSFQVERGIVAIVTLKRRRHAVREVPIPPELMAQIERHFGLLAAQRREQAPAKPLWDWRRETAWRIIKQAARAAGLSGVAASPRGLRHAFGVGALQAGVPLNLVQRWLGHARMSTTAIYTDASGAEERGFAERFWYYRGG